MKKQYIISMILGMGCVWGLNGMLNNNMHNNNMPLHHAAQNGHQGVIHAMLNQDMGIMNLQDNLHGTPLLFAAQNGHLEVIHVLLNHGQHINEHNQHQNQPNQHALGKIIY